ncbi:MAG: hypothetical protein ACR2OD_02000, partial [Gaiellaceae bacterium]
ILRLGVGSHRADIAVLECTKAVAALELRTETTQDDILVAAELVLPHRLTQDPFGQEPQWEAEGIERILEDVLESRTAKKKTPAMRP